MQRLDLPAGLCPTSQEAGGLIHDPAAAMTAPGTPPGFDGGSLAYAQSTDLPAPGYSGPAVPLPTDGIGGQPRDGMGRWTGDQTGPSPWVKTGTAS